MSPSNILLVMADVDVSVAAMSLNDLGSDVVERISSPPCLLSACRIEEEKNNEMLNRKRKILKRKRLMGGFINTNC